MHIQKESRNTNSITGYDPFQVIVNQVSYSDSVIISRDRIIPSWPVHAITEITIQNLAPLIEQSPEVILIGHANPTLLLHNEVKIWLSEQRIGIESMPIGAACRTFNVLLTEDRHCVAGIIFQG
jgi:uncharacterized protein